MLTTKDAKKILDIAILAGQIMLENGAETYRVEETIDRICYAKGLSGVTSFTVPTGIFLAYSYRDEDFSYVKRIRTAQIDLRIVSMVQTFFNEFTTEDIPLDVAIAQLQEIRQTPHYPPFTRYLAGGVGGGFFTMIFGGTLPEGIIAICISLIVTFVAYQISRKTKAFFLKNVGGGMVNTTLTLLTVHMLSMLAGLHLNPDVIIIGAVMPLVPGVAMVNAFRDTISGDFVSGISKLAEALGVAMAIALGVAVVLQIALLISGGALL